MHKLKTLLNYCDLFINFEHVLKDFCFCKLYNVYIDMKQKYLNRIFSDFKIFTSENYTSDC